MHKWREGAFQSQLGSSNVIKISTPRLSCMVSYLIWGSRSYLIYYAEFGFHDTWTCFAPTEIMQKLLDQNHLLKLIIRFEIITRLELDNISIFCLFETGKIFVADSDMRGARYRVSRIFFEIKATGLKYSHGTNATLDPSPLKGVGARHECAV